MIVQSFHAHGILIVPSHESHDFLTESKCATGIIGKKAEKITYYPEIKK
jgi:light-regulated signal transduction histidine kinase (bacteriophytochrome)